MTWLSIIVAGILTYLTRMTMVALVSRDMLGDKIKAVLAYVPSAVFPAIIFPGVFINDYGQFIEMDDKSTRPTQLNLCHCVRTWQREHAYNVRLPT